MAQSCGFPKVAKGGICPPQVPVSGPLWLDGRSVINGVAELLLAPEVMFRGLDGDMPHQELNLIQLLPAR